jgi:hypothetical protein
MIYKKKMLQKIEVFNNKFYTNKMMFLVLKKTQFIGFILKLFFYSFCHLLYSLLLYKHQLLLWVN